ncbi:hypothetical protein EZS27_036012 [termite gut metagenome]|uniref:HTH-like domain-containing protein n=1 Tax=termite gut metagenome TaxID=433724 RepID=A0A5J4PUN7_9ZZZZ
MARSVFYYHRKRLNADNKYKHEKEEIKRIYHLHKGRYGYRRITAEMKHLGYKINHKTVQKLMGVLELRCKVRKVLSAHTKVKLEKLPRMCLKETLKQNCPIRNGLQMSLK